MANESGQEMCETLADIEADLRVMARKFIGYHGVGWCEGGRLMALADRIEAAWRRERESLMLGPRSWEECIERYKKAREIHDDLY